MTVSRINRQQALTSLQAYLPNDTEIVRIINMCCLNPIGGWRVWQNEYSPFIKVQNNKKISIGYKGENFFEDKNDLYAYSNAASVAKISKKLLLIKEKDCFCFLFWGNDNQLRYRRQLNDNSKLLVPFRNNVPLVVPIEDIRTFIKQEHIDGHVKVSLISKHTMGWVTCWPPKSEFYNEVKKETNLWNSQVESLILEH